MTEKEILITYRNSDEIGSSINSKIEYILDTELILKQKTVLQANGMKISYFDEINKELTTSVI